MTALDQRLLPLERFRSTVVNVRAALETQVTNWRAARQGLASTGAPYAISSRVDSVVGRLEKVSVKLRRTESAVAVTSAQVARMRAMVDEVFAMAETEGPSLVDDFGERGESPFRFALPTWQEVSGAVIESNRHAFRTGVRFLQVSVGGLVVQALAFFALWMFAWRGRRVGVPTADAAGLIFRRPIASSLLSTFALGLLLYPAVPASVALVELTLALVCASILLFDEDMPHKYLFLVGGLVLTAFLHLQVTFTQLPEARRWLYGAQGLAVVYFALRLVTGRLRVGERGWNRILSFVARLWLLFSCLGLLMWALAFEVAAAILIDGTGRLMLLSVALRLSYDVLTSFVRALLSTEVAMASRMVRLRGPVIADRVALFLRWGFVYLWLDTGLRIYTLRTPVVSTLQGVVSERFEIGSVSVTLGDGLTLALGICLAVYLSRFVRFLLDEEVLPRTHMSLGSRAAITQSAGYLVLGVGAFMALAAIGFELDRLTLLVSALGVGIGFGLQNIVQNFVAGLILIFGRPINVGDSVEVGGLFGTVSEVGFRASVVKTFQGAEVIVPNSQFVSDQVINWSLSDDNRRIEVDVGVKYGTEPERVLAILVELGKAHPDVMSEPAPEAIMVAFGASSLDFQLRCWTSKGSAWLGIRSALTVAINRRFAEEEIEIPFPQRDLNIRTLDDVVLSKLPLPVASPSASPSGEAD